MASKDPITPWSPPAPPAPTPIGDAARIIRYGDADVMIAGGAEAAVCKLGIAGFVACRAMATGFNDRPPGRLAALR